MPALCLSLGLVMGNPQDSLSPKTHSHSGTMLWNLGVNACVLSELIVTYSQGGHCPLCTHMPGGGIIASHWSTVFTVASYLER